MLFLRNLGLVATNVLQLGEVADLEALTFNLVLMFIRIPNIQFSTKPAILPNCCYSQFSPTKMLLHQYPYRKQLQQF